MKYKRRNTPYKDLLKQWRKLARENIELRTRLENVRNALLVLKSEGEQKRGI